MTPPSRPRHIAIYVPSLAGGGAEHVMMMLANGFAARGHRVDLVLAKAEGQYLLDVHADVRIVNLDKRRVIASLIPLARYLKRERPAAMLSALSHANIIAILGRKISGVKTRLVVSERANLANLGYDRRGAIVRRLMRYAYPHADSVIGISHGIVEELASELRLPCTQLHAVHNPLDLDRVQRLMREPIELDILPDDGTPLIIAAGRLHDIKDYPTLLRAFARLRAQRSVRLAILGQGEEEEALKKMAHDLGLAGDVIFAGFQKNPFAWIRRCDVYVLSSASEGFGNVLTEAMACGAKIVSTDCRSGPSEILEGGKWGRLVPVGDDAKLAAAIIAALDDPAPPDVQRRAADFRIEYAVDEYEKILCS